jgi:hypothetical protein
MLFHVCSWFGGLGRKVVDATVHHTIMKAALMSHDSFVILAVEKIPALH